MTNAPSSWVALEFSMCLKTEYTSQIPMFIGKMIHIYIYNSHVLFYPHFSDKPMIYIYIYISSYIIHIQVGWWSKINYVAVNHPIWSSCLRENTKEAKKKVALAG